MFNHPHSRTVFCFHKLNGTATVSVCAHCLSPYNWTAEKSLASSLLLSIRLTSVRSSPLCLKVKQSKLSQPLLPLLSFVVAQMPLPWLAAWRKDLIPSKPHYSETVLLICFSSILLLWVDFSQQVSTQTAASSLPPSPPAVKQGIE